MYAPYISDELRLHVLSLLYVGVPVETIMQRHTETVEKQGGPTNRDDLLTHRYVRRLERSIRRFSYEVDVDDAVSTRKWVDSHRNHIFYYEDFTDLDPVVVGIQTDWQLQQMISFGNRSLIALDSSIGPNKLKVCFLPSKFILFLVLFVNITYFCYIMSSIQFKVLLCSMRATRQSLLLGSLHLSLQV